MSTEVNKRIVVEFFSHFATNDVDAVLEAMSDDATWWIAGKRTDLPTAGQHSKAGIARILRRMAEEIPNGLRMTIKGTLAEGDKVALELESRGELRNGRVYNNEYHTIVTVRDEKVCEVREYLDTQHVLATWFTP